jgi:Domain of unknown function (DUF4177)
MKTTTQTVFAVLIAFMLVGCATPERQATAWEYKIVSGQVAGQSQLQEQINKAAADGWIFVSTAGYGDSSGYAVMKRPGSPSSSPQRGAAYGREEELRRQLAESVPMKDYGYTIKDLRFAPDYRKALVIFTHPDHQKGLDSDQRRPDWEFVLTADDFGRYHGTAMQPFYTPGTANTPPIHLTVTFLPK